MGPSHGSSSKPNKKKSSSSSSDDLLDYERNIGGYHHGGGHHGGGHSHGSHGGDDIDDLLSGFEPPKHKKGNASGLDAIDDLLADLTG